MATHWVFSLARPDFDGAHAIQRGLAGQSFFIDDDTRHAAEIANSDIAGEIDDHRMAAADTILVKLGSKGWEWVDFNCELCLTLWFLSLICEPINGISLAKII